MMERKMSQEKNLLMREYRKKNRARYNLYMREYNKRNKEQVSQNRKKNYTKNAERYRGYRRAYYQAHKEERLVWYKAHTRTVRGRHTQVKGLLRKEKISSLDPLWGLNYYTELIKDNQCHYCLGPLNQTGHALDRVDNSLPHMCSNVVVSCWWCNEKKSSDLSYSEMLLLAPALREIRKRRESEKCGSAPVHVVERRFPNATRGS
jgi:hypothetical protein